MNLITLESWLSANFAYLWYFCYVGYFLLFGLMEYLVSLRVNECPRLSRYSTNLSLLFINSDVQRLLLPILPLAVAIYANENSWGVFNALSLDPVLSICLSFLILDLFGYWFHKVMHYSHFLWRIHHTHHTDIDFDVTTGLRFHPLEALLTTSMEIILVFLFGISPLAVILFSLVHIFTGLFTHLNVRFPKCLDKALRLFIVTPNMHRIHHSARVEESLSNYGIVLSIWDRLFKSYIKEPVNGHKGMKLGLMNRRDPEKTMLIAFLMLPFRFQK